MHNCGRPHPRTGTLFPDTPVMLDGYEDGVDDLQPEQAVRLDAAIWENLSKLGFGE